MSGIVSFPKNLTLSILCLGCCIAAGAQNLLVFDTPGVSLDTLRYDADSVKVEYWCKNVSASPVTILQVHSSCGCFEGEASARSIAPGGRARVVAWFKPASLHGPQKRHLTVVATDGAREVLSSLSIQAYILRDQTEGEIRFPEHLGEGIRTDALENPIGLPDSFGDMTFAATLYNDTPRSVVISFSCEDPRMEIYTPQLTLRPHSRGVLRGRFDPLWLRRGKLYSTAVKVQANGTEITSLEFHVKL